MISRNTMLTFKCTVLILHVQKQDKITMFCTSTQVSLGNCVCPCETWTITCFVFTGSKANRRLQIEEYLCTKTALTNRLSLLFRSNEQTSNRGLTSSTIDSLNLNRGPISNYKPTAYRKTKYRPRRPDLACLIRPPVCILYFFLIRISPQSLDLELSLNVLTRLQNQSRAFGYLFFI